MTTRVPAEMRSSHKRAGTAHRYSLNTVKHTAKHIAKLAARMLTTLQ